MPTVSNVEEFRHSLQNRRSANMSKPRPRPRVTCLQPTLPRPTVATNFQMTPSLEFTKQAQLTQSHSIPTSNTPEHRHGADKIL